MLTIELTEEQAKNLQVFLTRVDLKGLEAVYFTQIFGILSKAIEELEPK